MVYLVLKHYGFGFYLKIIKNTISVEKTIDYLKI